MAEDDSRGELVVSFYHVCPGIELRLSGLGVSTFTYETASLSDGDVV